MLWWVLQIHPFVELFGHKLEANENNICNGQPDQSHDVSEFVCASEMSAAKLCCQNSLAKDGGLEKCSGEWQCG